MFQPDGLAALLSRTAEAHHRAFISTGGADPDWPTWYARYLLDNGLGQVAGDAGLSANDLAYLLVEADRLQRAEVPQPTWETYYAKVLLAHLDRSE